MTDIEDRLRAAMHTAVDGEEAPHDLISLVMRRHRRHAALVAGGTVLAVIVIGAVPAVLALRGEGGPSAIRPASSASPVITSRSPATPTPHRSHQSPSRLRGLPMPAGTDLQLLLNGPRPERFSIATGASEPIGGLPVTKSGFALTRVGGGWAASPYFASPLCRPACSRSALLSYFVADGSSAATPISVGTVSPSARVGAVWLTTLGRNRDHRATAPANAQLFTITGQPIGPKYHLPPGYLIIRAVGRYLLLGAASQPGSPTYQLWDPVAGHLVRGFANVIASSPDQIAWTAGCLSCAVHVLTVPTSQSVSIPLSRREWAYNGTFSSDGRYLAVQLSAGVTADGRATRERIGVIDLANLRLIPIQGTIVSVDKTLNFGWEAGHHRLVVALAKSADSMQVAYWQPGDTHLLVTTTHVPRGMSPVLGDSG